MNFPTSHFTPYASHLTLYAYEPDRPKKVLVCNPDKGKPRGKDNLLPKPKGDKGISAKKRKTDPSSLAMSLSFAQGMRSMPPAG